VIKGKLLRWRISEKTNSYGSDWIERQNWSTCQPNMGGVCVCEWGVCFFSVLISNSFFFTSLSSPTQHLISEQQRCNMQNIFKIKHFSCSILCCPLQQNPSHLHFKPHSNVDSFHHQIQSTLSSISSSIFANST
jgi:hypothetical protein